MPNWSRLFARRKVAPDDERSLSPGLYVMVGLVSMGLFALFLAFLVVPPALAAHLVIQGRRGDATGLRLVGYGLLAAWFAGLVLIGRRVMRPAPTPPEAPGE